MGDVRRFVRLEQFPADRRVVIHFRFPDAGPRETDRWLVVEDRVADLCRDDPGHDLTLQVLSSVRALTEVWTGDATPEAVVRSRQLQAVGPTRDADRLWE